MLLCLHASDDCGWRHYVLQDVHPYILLYTYMFIYINIYSAKKKRVSCLELLEFVYEFVFKHGLVFI